MTYCFVFADRNKNSVKMFDIGQASTYPATFIITGSKMMCRLPGEEKFTPVPHRFTNIIKNIGDNID